jgi:sugar/nucleoside kinase (ribokinase family)
VVVKQGAQGALLASSSGVHTTDALPADVVDTTGAGDAFCAGFLAAWTTSPDPETALAAGARAAARLVTRLGARP